jgi:hypothetical protein
MILKKAGIVVVNVVEDELVAQKYIPAGSAIVGSRIFSGILLPILPYGITPPTSRGTVIHISAGMYLDRTV